MHSEYIKIETLTTLQYIHLINNYEERKSY